MRRTILATTSVAAVMWSSSGRVASQAPPARPIAVAATRTDAAFRTLDTQVDQWLRTRDLRVRDVMRDADLPDRRHERMDQFFHGVRIFGGDMTRQTAPDGTVSIFGMLHTGIDIDTTPRIPASDARAAIARSIGGEPVGADAELVVLLLSDGYHLAYYGQAFDGTEIQNVFIDANNAALLRKYSEFITEVGKGKGTFGDDKKVSTKAMSGTFVTDDALRPAAITTFDLKGNLGRTMSVLSRFGALTPSDIASDSDNIWTDPTVVDAHVYAGWYYDYLFKRFGRHGIDDRELRIVVLSHPVNQADIFFQPGSVIGLFYLNAFFCSTCGSDGRGTVLFGEGAPAGFVGPFDVKPFSAALDVVAHELTHAVTAVTSNLNGFPFSEAGALNEAMSDVFGNSTAFFNEPPGPGNLQADYVIGKDLTSPPGLFAIRNLANPAATRDPDHYSRRVIGGDPHFNSTIASHAFFLAVEGGTNRTSGRTVQGVGANNRVQIERAFFRANTMLMTPGSTFALTRTATIQAARDLFGTGSPAERAITQAWDAVGVQERTAATAALGPDGTDQCGLGPQPNFVFGLTASAGSSNLRVTQWTVDVFDMAGTPLQLAIADGATGRTLTSGVPINAAGFSQSFQFCGPGSSTVMAQTDACAYLCVGLAGRTSGSAQFSYSALDDAGRTVTATSGPVVLR